MQGFLVGPEGPVIIYVGRKVPKGYEELPGGVHIFKGLWMLRMRKLPAPQKIKKSLGGTA